MNRFSLLSLAIGATALLAACAPEVKTEAVQSELAPLAPPVMTIGDTWVWQSGDQQVTRTVTSTDGGLVTYEQSDGCTYASASLFAPSEKWSDCAPFTNGSQSANKSGEIYPLAVGQTVSYAVSGSNVDGNDWSTTRNCAVKGTARVTVPAGAFDTYHVTCNDEWNTRDYYIAPENGQMVLYRQLRRSQNQVIQRELVSFTPGSA